MHFLFKEIVTLLARISKELIKLNNRLIKISKRTNPISKDWIPWSEVMEFFDYADTQMSTLAKEADFKVCRIGNRKFIHRDSIITFLENNIQGEKD